MTTLSRRGFIHAGTSAATAWALPAMRVAPGSVRAKPAQSGRGTDLPVVRLTGDGLGLNPAQYTRLLLRLAEEKAIVPDSYSLGGAIEELENRFARVLGKEQAIFLPTGTLANHLAVRALAGGPSRVVVQERSHLYHDEGDCAQTLSGLTLMPLAPERATFTGDEVQKVLADTTGGRVASRVSVISIETPVRRRQGERFDADELLKIVALARREGIKLHLDGARLFVQAAYTGHDVAPTAALFDTVYVSLYKYFNAASGAILAGPSEVIDGMYHVRRMFGGGLNQAWPFAVVALHHLADFNERFSRAVRTSEDLIRALAKDDRFAIQRVPSGTNLFRLRVTTADPRAFQKTLAAGGFVLPAAQGDTFLVAVNETLNRSTAADAAAAFVAALDGRPARPSQR